MGHTCAHMKPREWKWADVEERPKKVGVEKTADKCGKKWDNLMQQFKKVHLFHGESGKHEFFQLTGKERSARGFNFTMDRAVYEDIKGSTAKSHTINLKNVADTGSSGGVQLSSGFAGSSESVSDGDAGGDDNDEEDKSTKGSSPARGSSGSFGKRKNVRQRTFKVLTECMKKHGTLMTTTMESVSKRTTARCPFVFHNDEWVPKWMTADQATKVVYDVGHPIAHFTPSLLSVIVLVVFTMSSHDGNRGKKRDNLEAAAFVAVKKGHHQPKNKNFQAVAEGPLRGGVARDDKWVRDFEGAGDDNDFVSETEVEAVRQASGVCKADDVIDADAGHLAREVQLDAAPQTAPAERGIARTPVTALPDAQDSTWVQSPPATPHGQAVPEKGGGVEVVVQGCDHGAHRQDPIASQGGAVAGSSRPTAIAATAESRGEGDDDEPW
ncbi:hypothetical protein CBR_g44389 [Chara braunii]|uniref:Myb/SANT-like DNA-binding domain-containing protein n=1 Tax=Chara braunii TaxID=69332 RepID=A0A388LX98_CHABU|nr:hypothetical protein CBR_g44389 [Chara braunii]|eukprot:GBG86936.1 hypothetical protein CBR_g44389 [Chara braunii]